jgi:hypothetical protein
MNPQPLVPLFAVLVLGAARAEAAEGDRPRPPDVLAEGRLELRPYGGWAAFPNSATGGFVGADVAFRLTPVVAVGIDAAWYGPFNRSAGATPTYPLNETRDSADIEVLVAPWPARRTNAFEPYLLGGIGAVQTRPIAVVDPVNRTFQYNTLVDLAPGAGVRFFLHERIAVTLELRDLLYFEKVENHFVATGTASGPGQPGFGNSPLNPSFWYDPSTHFANAIQLRLGASFFVFGG